MGVGGRRKVQDGWRRVEGVSRVEEGQGGEGWRKLEDGWRRLDDGGGWRKVEDA